MGASFNSDARKSGFTLMELLTVVAIIAILMALLLPALNAAKNQAKKSQAHSDCAALVNAVHNYYVDYGFYPLNSTNAAAGNGVYGQYDTVYGDPNGLYSSANLCNILRAIPETGSTSPGPFNQSNQLNPRQVIYFEGQNAKSITNPRGGFVMNPSGVTGPANQRISYGSYVDPWGMEYVVFIDANYDGTLSEAPSGATAAIGWFYNAPLPIVHAGAAAISLGPDCTWGTNGNKTFQGSDDIATWQ